MLSELSLTHAVGGGLLIGLSAILLLFFIGRIAGISGITGSLLHTQPGWHWRGSFLIGLIGAGFLLPRLTSISFSPVLTGNWILWVIAGLLVGFGSRLGSGCTSGHGICGLSRLSLRSMASVMLFMGVAIITATVSGLIRGGGL